MVPAAKSILVVAFRTIGHPVALSFTGELIKVGVMANSTEAGRCDFPNSTTGPPFPPWEVYPIATFFLPDGDVSKEGWILRTCCNCQLV